MKSLYATCPAQSMRLTTVYGAAGFACCGDDGVEGFTEPAPRLAAADMHRPHARPNGDGRLPLTVLNSSTSRVLVDFSKAKEPRRPPAEPAVRYTPCAISSPTTNNPSPPKPLRDVTAGLWSASFAADVAISGSTSFDGAPALRAAALPWAGRPPLPFIAAFSRAISRSRAIGTARLLGNGLLP